MIDALSNLCLSGPFLRDELRKYMIKLGEIINIPWVIIGGCNQPISIDDKMGGRSLNRNRAARLQAIIDTSQLLDLSFRGSNYTWSNMEHGPTLIREHIDQAWFNL